MKFNKAQQEFINSTIESWFHSWDKRLVRTAGAQHNLKLATEQLKSHLLLENKEHDTKTESEDHALS